MKTQHGRPITLLAIAILATTITGCAAAAPTPGAPAAAAPQHITGNWILTAAVDSKGAMSLGGATVTLKIDGDQSGGQGPCNAYGAKIKTTGPKPGDHSGDITITEGMHTEMACAESSRNVLEQRYFAALGQLTEAVRDGHTLVLRGHGVELDFTGVR